MEKEYLAILLEDMNSQFGLVLEGHEALRSEIREARDESNAKHEHTAFLINVLNDKIDAVEEKLSKKIDAVAADLKATDKRLGKKIDAVASDLKAHRADTEAHGSSGLYVVREE